MTPQTTPTTTAPMMINLDASKDSTHPDFATNFGKILSTVVLGLQVYAAESQTAGGAAGFFSNPQNLSNIISGFSQIWVTK